MELKNALGVCLISLFSATLVVLIARQLDSQAAARLEPHLIRIAERLESMQSSSGAAVSSAAAETSAVRDGLVVYYFYSNTRCATCRSIESQARQTVEADFGDQLDRGEIVWKSANYEEPASAELAKKFEIEVPVVVLARMKNGEMEDWTRLDQVWGFVNDPPAFANLIRTEVSRMLGESAAKTPAAAVKETPAIPVPGDGALPLPLPK